MSEKRPGRPPLAPGDKSVQITVALPSKHLLELCNRAEAERRPLREFVRELLKQPKPK